MHTGLITRLKTVDQLRAVMAPGRPYRRRDMVRRDEAMGGARGIAVIGAATAIAAVLSGAPGAGLAVAAGSQHAARRAALAHSRAEEASADQAGLRYMAAAGGLTPRRSSRSCGCFAAKRRC